MTTTAKTKLKTEAEWLRRRSMGDLIFVLVVTVLFAVFDVRDKSLNYWDLLAWLIAALAGIMISFSLYGRAFDLDCELSRLRRSAEAQKGETS